MTVQERTGNSSSSQYDKRILYKQKYIKTLLYTFDASSNMFFRDCMAYLIEEEIKEVERLKKKYIQQL
jgi:hypothetical protein